MSLDFQVKADFSKTINMLNRFGSKATTEYRTALRNTSVYGLREVKTATPVRTGTAKNTWKWAFTDKLITGITNNVGYLEGLVKGWSRTKPIIAKGKALVFEVGERKSAKSSTKSLYKRYTKAMKSLKGKGLDAKEKQRQAVAKSGVVVVRQVNTPAKFKGNDFITPVVNRIDRKFMNEITEANRRLFYNG